MLPIFRPRVALRRGVSACTSTRPSSTQGFSNRRSTSTTLSETVSLRAKNSTRACTAAAFITSRSLIPIGRRYLDSTKAAGSITPAYTRSKHTTVSPAFAAQFRSFSAPSSVPKPPSAGDAEFLDSRAREVIHADENAHPSTAARLKQDARYLLQLYGRPDVIFTHGKGCYLYDQAGRSFLDLAGGIAVNALGHADKEITSVIADQAGKLIHLSNLYHNEYAGPFAKAIIESLPKVSEGGLAQPGSKVFFCNSGTEANEAALKFGRKFGRQNLKAGEVHTKSTIVSFTNAFHGRSMGSLSATPSIKYQTPFMPLIPSFVHAPLNDIEKAKQIIDDNVCAVIVEPVQGEGGINLSSKEFLQVLRKRCDEVNAVLIFDEIQCGLGRTGSLFAYEQFDIAPDILTMAKPLANGIPIGAVIVSPEVAKHIHPGDHGTTFGGSPFATRVGHTVYNRINNPSFLAHVREMGEYLRRQCEELASSSPLISEVRGAGLMVGLQMRASVDPNLFVDMAREQGVLVISAGNNTVRLVPPLIITKKEIDEAVRVFEDVITDMESYIASGKDLKG
ncbi:pyridoxal phosphate-dependent transferase [Fimicolochytrium jonesii]|uniref:pyridoxal phosphate-dependent transferase n=1 Tax=Fimicolochytrium jonesii TaxID=1396493 RepID=UPI0022FE587D|nr:pyridoxal phosphate-dependent transferase [Fimicolochytrium jonesii]KAI8822591.1 pyridoxal phosphate-dependent transferase [Fimicolochytrium jonesii]